MRVTSAITSLMLATTAAVCHAGYECKGIVSRAQSNGLYKMFGDPDGSPNFVHISGPQSDNSNWSKKVSKTRLTQISEPAPRVRQHKVLGDEDAKELEGYLDSRANETVPGWVTLTTMFIPISWVSVPVDTLFFAMDASTAESRLTASKISGRITKNATLAVLERASPGKSGTHKYFFSIVLKTNIDGIDVVSPLWTCLADLVVE